MKRIIFTTAIIVVFCLTGCTRQYEGPDLALLGGSVLVGGMALGRESPFQGMKDRKVEGCQKDEALAEIIGPEDYCKLVERKFLNSELTNDLVVFKDNKLHSLSFSASSSEFCSISRQLEDIFGVPNSIYTPAPNTITSKIPGSGCDGRTEYFQDYRIWETEAVLIRLYRHKPDTVDELSFWLSSPVNALS